MIYEGPNSLTFGASTEGTDREIRFMTRGDFMGLVQKATIGKFTGEE
jgi:hypothetical protein